MVLEFRSLDWPLWAFGSFGLSCHVVDGLLTTGILNEPDLYRDES